MSLKKTLFIFFTILLSITFWLGIQYFIFGMLRLFDAQQSLPYNLINSIPDALLYMSAFLNGMSAFSICTLFYKSSEKSWHTHLYRSFRAIVLVWTMFVQMGIIGLIMISQFWLHEQKSIYTYVILIFALSLVWLILDVGLFWRRQYRLNVKSTISWVLFLFGLASTLHFIRIPSLKEFKKEVAVNPYYYFQSQRVKLKNANRQHLSTKRRPVMDICIKKVEDGIRIYSIWEEEEYVSVKSCVDSFIRGYPDVQTFNCFWESDSMLEWKVCRTIIDTLRKDNRFRNILWSANTYYSVYYNSNYPKGMKQSMFPIPGNYEDSLRVYTFYSEKFTPINLPFSEDLQFLTDLFRKELASELIRNDRVVVNLEIPENIRLWEYLHLMDELISIKNDMLDLYAFEQKSISFLFKEDVDRIKGIIEQMEFH